MRRWLRWAGLVFKWSMVVLGVLFVHFAFFYRGSEEVFLVGDTNCDFSFGLPKGEWAADPNSATYANIPVMVRKSELAKPTLFLSMNRFWRDDKSPGGWRAVAEEKCQLASRGTVRTTDGKEAKVFLASGCDVTRSMEGGQFKSPMRGNTLYGYVVYDDRLADFLYLSASDPALVLRHEDVLLSALKSYSTSSTGCVARRTAVKKLEVTR